ncbi:hypothetical protein [Eisenbergiella sp.]
MRTIELSNNLNLKKNKFIIISGFIVFLFVFFLGLLWSQTKLTYLEYTTLNASADSYIEIADIGDEIKQEFIMPYDIFHGISVQIGTLSRDNNSIWNIAIREKLSGKIVVEDTFNASLIEDNEFHLYDFDKNYQVNKGKKYELIIRPTKVSSITSLVFYCSLKSQINDSAMTINSKTASGDLCMQIHGGDKDFWWTGLVLFLGCYIMLLAWRGIAAIRYNKKWIQDKVFMSLLLGGVVFLLLFSFSVSGSFTDEVDNMRGGMIIAKGGGYYIEIMLHNILQLPITSVVYSHY